MKERAARAEAEARRDVALDLLDLVVPACTLMDHRNDSDMHREGDRCPIVDRIIYAQADLSFRRTARGAGESAGEKGR
jgi:hypothetical protein